MMIALRGACLLLSLYIVVSVCLGHAEAVTSEPASEGRQIDMISLGFTKFLKNSFSSASYNDKISTIPEQDRIMIAKTCEDTTENFEVVEPSGRNMTITCDWVKEESTNWRCDNIPGVIAQCPDTCNACCTNSEDEYEVTIGTFAGKMKTCAWAGDKVHPRCDDPVAQTVCPASCGMCPPSPTTAPTTVHPTSSTTAPTAPPVGSTPEPTSMPTGYYNWCKDTEERFDITSVHWINNKKNCKWAAEGNRWWTCSLAEVQDYCPELCGTCKCINNRNRFKVKGNNLKSCTWAANKDTWWRCNNVQNVRKNCPLLCGECKEDEFPSSSPSVEASSAPSITPSVLPSIEPTFFPSEHPSASPSKKPTIKPSPTPSRVPTETPSLVPSVLPSLVPSLLPSLYPSKVPSSQPTECENENGWSTPLDVAYFANMTCADIEISDSEEATKQWCNILSNDKYSNYGKTVQEACCVCGGSDFQTIFPSTIPTQTPSQVPSVSQLPSSQPTDCKSEPGWLFTKYNPDLSPEEESIDLTCHNIEELNNPQKMCDNIAKYIYDGKTASQACCVCGGRADDPDAPSASPSDTPSLSPSTSPSTSPTLSKSSEPSAKPSALPTIEPTPSPTTDAPSSRPSFTSGSRYNGDSCRPDLIASGCAEFSTCSEVDKICKADQSFRINTNLGTSFAGSYGENEDGQFQQDFAGGIQVNGNGKGVVLYGNAWKAFQLINPITVNKDTALSFKFHLEEEAEGHAICIDEDLIADTFGGVEIRCWMLGGSEYDDWETVHKINNQRVLPGAHEQTFTIEVGKSFESTSTKIKYIVFIQDNDLKPETGKSTFRDITLTTGSSRRSRALSSNECNDDNASKQDGECLCNDGYVSAETGGKKLEPTDKCISCLLSDFFKTTSSSFNVKVRRPSNTEKIEPELLQIAHPNNVKVDLEGKLVMEDKETNSPLIDYKFFDLLPGKQYSVKIDTKYRKQDKPVYARYYYGKDCYNWKCNSGHNKDERLGNLNIPLFDAGEAKFAGSGRGGNFGAKFEAYLYFEKGGQYTFCAQHDDWLRIHVSNTIVYDHDDDSQDLRCDKNRRFRVGSNGEYHKVTVYFWAKDCGLFGCGETGLVVQWKTPNNSMAVVIPTKNWYQDIPEPRTYQCPVITSCSCSSDTSDRSGTPKDFKVLQIKGHVMFEMRDNSYCEDGYALTRADIVEDFTPVSKTGETFNSVYYVSSGKDCDTVIKPERDLSDDLKDSKLTVGNKYKYCVRAVHQNDYMAYFSHDVKESRTLTSSYDNCKIHTINWEASINGYVTTELHAGSVPIMNVEVHWELLDSNDKPINCPALSKCSGVELTTDGGAFTISIKADHPNLYDKNDEEFPVRLFFLKTSDLGSGKTVDHEFLCNDGAYLCDRRNGYMVYLKHLEFDKPLHIYDDTSVPFKGIVSIADTGYPGNEDHGCRIVKAEVCLLHREPGTNRETELGCDETDANGHYLIPIVVGSVVHKVDIRYHNHDFTPAKISAYSSRDYEQGITIEAEKEYLDHHFEDSTKATLFVDVVGGECEHVLGNNEIKVKVKDCDWESQQMNMRKKGIFNKVPAHFLEVRVADFDSEYGSDTTNKIKDYFSAIIRTIDLKDEGIIEDAFDEGKAAEIGRANGSEIDERTSGYTQTVEKQTRDDTEKDIEKVRFQYDGELKMDVIFDEKVNEKSCTNEEYPFTAVIATMTVFRVDILFKHILIEEAYITCDIVDEDIKLHITNKIGVDNNLGYDYWSSNVSPEEKEALEECSPQKSGCLLDIEHEEDANGKKRRAHVSKLFLTGRPEPYAPYSRDMIFEVTDIPDPISYTASIFVQGSWSPGPGLSFALPFYEPVMILRDPPGGLSSASYKNVVTTMKVRDNSWGIHAKSMTALSIKAQAEADMDTCTGGGGGMVGPSFQLCKNAFETEALSDVADLDGSATMHFVDRTEKQSNTFTTTWSYTTSTDAKLAGRESDVFVVPNLNVMYHLVYDVSFDNTEGECKPVFDEDPKKQPQFPSRTEFSIESATPAMSFYTRYSIGYRKIPEIKRTITELEGRISSVNGGGALCCCEDLNENNSCPAKVLSNCECTDDKKQLTLDELNGELNAMNDGLKGWKSALKIDENLVKERKEAKIVEWFDNFGAKGMHSDSLAGKIVGSIGAIGGAAAVGKTAAVAGKAALDSIGLFIATGSSPATAAASSLAVGGTAAIPYLALVPYISFPDFANVLDIKDHTSAIAPKSLTTDAKKLNTKLASDNADIDLNSINRIQFSGGGNKYSMVMNKERLDSFTANTNYKGRPFDATIHLNIANTELDTEVAGIGTKYKFKPFDYTLDVSHTATRTTTDTDSTTISFDLGDADKKDEFVVDLFYDSRYGSIIFDTAGGVSSCPHESGTMAIEKPILEIDNLSTGNYYLDEVMYFQLTLKNVGYDSSSLLLEPILSTNPGGVELSLDGAPFISGRSFFLAPGVFVTKTLVVRRGPMMYEYNSIDLRLKSGCGDLSKISTAKLFNRRDENGKEVLKWIDPCPKVHLTTSSTSLYDDQDFVVNRAKPSLNLSIFNSMHKRSSLKNMVESGALDRSRFDLKLRVRKQSEQSWNDVSEVNFLASDVVEDQNGIVSVEWEVDEKIFSSGSYKVRVESQCSPKFNEAPDGVNTASSQSLIGVIDFKVPEVYGKPLPLRDEIILGEEISIVFTEPINCVRPFSFSVVLIVGEDNLKEDTNDLDVICEGRKIGIAPNLDNMDERTLNELMGKPFTVAISQVEDRYGNMIEPEEYSFEKRFAEFDTDHASASLTLTLRNVTCVGETIRSLTLNIKSQVADMLHIEEEDKYRIQVGDVECIKSSNVVTSFVTILPPKSDKRRGLRSERKEHESTIELLYRLNDDDTSTFVDSTHSRRLKDGENVGIEFEWSGMRILPAEEDSIWSTIEGMNTTEMLDIESEVHRVMSLPLDVDVESNIDEIMHRDLEKELMKERKYQDERFERLEENEDKKLENLKESLEESDDKKLERLKESLEESDDKKLERLKESMKEQMEYQNAQLLQEIRNLKSHSNNEEGTVKSLLKQMGVIAVLSIIIGLSAFKYLTK